MFRKFDSTGAARPVRLTGIAIAMSVWLAACGGGDGGDGGGASAADVSAEVSVDDDAQASGGEGHGALETAAAAPVAPQFRLQEQANGECLNGGARPGATQGGLSRSDCAGTVARQGFALQAVSGDANAVTLQHGASGLCIDIQGASRSSGARALLWNCHGKPNQQFTRRDVGNGNYQLVARHSGLCLDVVDGARVEQRSCDSSQQRRSQLFKFPSLTTTPPTTGTPVARHGQLKVCGTQLCNSSGQPVQLRGMSTHGLQWYGQCITDGSLDALAKDWQADVIRISMYIQEGGYETDPEGFTRQVGRIIEEATERGMYAIVDWHMLTPGDPNYNLDRARTFFTQIAQKYGRQTNLLYEIANEPSGTPWSRIRSYANELIPVIRAVDPETPVIVGTPGWSSLGVSEGGGAQEIIDSPVSAGNVLYTFHFYAASHHQAYRDELLRASQRLPIFVTEFGTQEYTGDGGNDFGSSQAYMDLLNSRKISWVNWNYSDDHRSGAVWKQGTCASGNWSASNLKPAGVWVRDQMRKPR
ncbi:cellulase family glycosylhydrolase [Caldimonas brevitalea]|uniref:Cellulase n=1 Tax=Caldimonas brevitalea TaxID=413882 RepID=A0A0G3BNE1_9BURK|nr:cellulase family glycosylhydrolase [Caldimonas brevitalea]AKJ29508.1 cellulase [Caldimonas brevitalea]